MTSSRSAWSISKTALGVDFARIRDFRAGYGYAGIPDPNRDVATPDDSGICRIHLDTGESTMLVSLAQSVKIEPKHKLRIELNKDKETISLLRNLTGTVAVTARY